MTHDRVSRGSIRVAAPYASGRDARSLTRAMDALRSQLQTVLSVDDAGR